MRFIVMGMATKESEAGPPPGPEAFAAMQKFNEELAKNGITVNCVAPGATNTQMVAVIPPNVREALVAKIPLRRLANPEDIVEPPDVAVVIALQRALQKRGYTEVGAADGDIGRRTIAGIVRFRSERGLPEGLIDDALLAALGVAGSTMR